MENFVSKSKTLLVRTFLGGRFQRLSPLKKVSFFQVDMRSPIQK